MTGLQLMMRTRFRVLGLVLLVSLATGCGPGRNAESTLTIDEMSKDERAAVYSDLMIHGTAAAVRQDFADAAITYGLAAGLALTGQERAAALTMLASIELMAGEPESALETTKLSEAALRQAGGSSPNAYREVLKVRALALDALGREAEARRVGALAITIETDKDASPTPSAGPPGAPVRHHAIDMAFQPRIGDMRLRRTTRLKSDASGMIGYYNLIPALDRTPSLFQLSALVMHRPATDPRRDLDAAVQAIRTDNAEARLIKLPHPVSVAAADGTRITGWRAVLAMPSLDNHTEVLLFKARDALVHFRITYAAPSATAILPRIRTFLDNFDWPPVDPPGRRRG